MRKTYSKYKPTSVPWPSVVPEDWELVKISSVFKERKETVSDKDFAPLSVTMQGIVPQLETAAKTDNGDNRKKVCKGDFVINSRSDRKGSAGISPLDGSVSVISTVLNLSNKLSEKYVGYLLTNYYFQEEFYRYGKGIVADLWSTKYSNMKGICIPVPSLNEQIGIANYLDIKTEQINNFKAKKETIIADLKDQKQAIINELITKGINESVAFKDSGVLWLGKIPSHWQVWKLSHIAKTLSGSTPESSKINEYYNGSINWVRSTDLNDDELFDLPIKITQRGLVESACKIVPKNSVLIAMYGGDGTIGKNAILRIESALNQAVCAIVPSKKINSEFLFYYSKFLRPIWMLYANGARKDPNISQDIIKQIKVVLPPLDEQLDIVKHIKEKIAQIDIVISRVEKEIEKVKELKQSLIAEVVTGKIKIV